MRKVYTLLREYFLNGVYAYALFGLYALTISPYIIEFIDLGEENIFVAILGFIVYVAEFFALNFKLKMARIRSELRREQHRIATGDDIIPRPNRFVFFGLMIRIALRLIILMFSLTALGIPCTEKDMSPLGLTIMLIGLFIDLLGFAYIYFNTSFYREPAMTKAEFLTQEKENNRWLNINIPKYFSQKYFFCELLTDLVLHAYAIMLFTPIWYYTNQRWFEISESNSLNSRQDGLIPMLIAVSIVYVMPLRIGYWIEDSMMAFKAKEKIAMWLIFFIASIFSFLPTWAQINSSQIESIIFMPQYINLTLSIFLILIVVIMHLIINNNKEGPQIQVVES